MIVIAIQKTIKGFFERWVEYCSLNDIRFKIVDVYRNDVINQMKECDALMWHLHQNNPKDILFAKQLIYSLENSGKKVFPNFNTVWHFDDKLGQKYLLEAIGAPLVPTWVFYDQKEALEWANQTQYPKVFKLRNGAGSQNVRLIRSRNQANKIIKKAFSRGFPAYDPVGSLKERLRLYSQGKTTFIDIIEGIARFLVPPQYSLYRGRERGYVYFQEFVANNDHDIRVVVIGNRAFAIKRMVREGDFRASGSGNILYDKSLFNEDTIELSFRLADKLKSQCVAFDYIFENGKPLVTEISYGFSPEGYDPCPGYWDKELNWYESKFNPYGWMVEDLVVSLRVGEKT